MKTKQETNDDHGRLRAVARSLAQDMDHLLREAEEQGLPSSSLRHIARRDLQRYHELTRRH